MPLDCHLPTFPDLPTSTNYVNFSPSFHKDHPGVYGQIPTPPNMPNEWKTEWVGKFTYDGCIFSGFMYYSDNLKQLRTDELFAWNTTSLCTKLLGGFVFAQDFNVFEEGYLYNYALPIHTAELKCAIIDLPYWWAPDYLQTSSYIGNITIEGIPCYEYLSTDVFIAGDVITYVSQMNNEIIGMRVRQPPLLVEDYTVIFQSGLKPAVVGEDAFIRPPIQCNSYEPSRTGIPKRFPFQL